MKLVCTQCKLHIEYKDLQSHAEEHNKSLVDQISVKQMFEEVKHRCTNCGEEKAVIRMKRLICQHCSHKSHLYAEME